MRISFEKVIYLINYLDKTFAYFWFIILFWFIVYFPFNNPLGRYYQSSNGAGGHALNYILLIIIGLLISLKNKSFSIGVFGMLTIVFLHESIWYLGFLAIYWHYLFTPNNIYILNSIPYLGILAFPLIFRSFRTFLKECVKFLIQYPYFLGLFSFWVFIGFPISVNPFIPHYINTNLRVNTLEIVEVYSFILNLMPIILKWEFFKRS